LILIQKTEKEFHDLWSEKDADYLLTNYRDHLKIFPYQPSQVYLLHKKL